MKKTILIIFFIVIAIVATFGYNYYNFEVSELEKYNINKYYNINGKELSCEEVANLINRTDDLNQENGIEKNKEGYYIVNSDDSIKIKITFANMPQTIFDFESIINKSSITKFVDAYSGAKFKCTGIDYHENTRKGCLCSSRRG